MRLMIALTMWMAACAPAGQPTLDLTLSPKRVTDATVVKARVAAVGGDLNVGKGTVRIRSTHGTLTVPAEVTLDTFGSGMAELVCDPALDPDCTAEVSVIADWTSGGVAVQAKAILNSGSSGAGGGTGGGTGAGGGTGGGAGCLTRPAGLVSWWRGEGNATDSVGSNSGTLSASGVTFVAGRVGQAFQFDGQMGNMTATSTGLPIGNADRTLELWARIEQATYLQHFFGGYGAFGMNDSAFELGAIQASRLPFFSQWDSSVMGQPMTYSTWTHVAVTLAGGRSTLFVNGTASAPANFTVSTPAGTSFYLGRVGGAQGDILRLNGAVDEVSVYSRALTAAEIGALASSTAGKCP